MSLGVELLEESLASSGVLVLKCVLGSKSEAWAALLGFK